MFHGGLSDLVDFWTLSRIGATDEKRSIVETSPRRVPSDPLVGTHERSCSNEYQQSFCGDLSNPGDFPLRLVQADAKVEVTRDDRISKPQRRSSHI